MPYCRARQHSSQACRVRAHALVNQQYPKKLSPGLTEVRYISIGQWCAITMLGADVASVLRHAPSCKTDSPIRQVKGIDR